MHVFSPTEHKANLERHTKDKRRSKGAVKEHHFRAV